MSNLDTAEAWAEVVEETGDLAELEAGPGLSWDVMLYDSPLAKRDGEAYGRIRVTEGRTSLEALQPFPDVLDRLEMIREEYEGS